MNVAWNKGLTKDDPRVKKYADKLRGRQFNAEWKEKMRLAKIGIKLSKSHRQSIQKSLTGRTRTQGERNSISIAMKGRTFTKQTREKMRLAKLGRKLSAQHKERIRSSWNHPQLRVSASERRAKQKIPLRDTIPEKLVQSILTKQHIGFETSYPIDLGFMRHQADIFVKPNRIIEVFGTYHHADPTKYKPDQILRVCGHSKVSRIWANDYKVLSAIRQKNYQVMVVWQRELQNDSIKETEQKILGFLK